MAAKIGEVHEISGELEIEWRIENFSSFYKIGETNFNKYESSAFYFAGSSWQFTLTPGTTDWRELTTDEIKLGLRRLSFGSPVKLECSFGIKNVDGENLILKTDSPVFDENPSRKKFPEFLWISKLQEAKSKLLPSDVLTLTCSLKAMEPNNNERSYFTRLLGAVENLQEMYDWGPNSDIVLNVEGDKYYMHRNILENRSPVFAGMFPCQQTGSRPQEEEVDVKDIDHRSMSAILNYMYTGNIVKLTTENMLSVYTAAAKFDLKEMKQLCSDYILRNLTVESVCDVIKLAESQKEEVIGHHAREYFFENAPKVLKTVQWKTFLKENRESGEKLVACTVEKLSGALNLED